MGTNYYAIKDRCDCCSRGERRHVGKSFRTLRTYLEDDEPTLSWQDWLAWFETYEPVIVDEYGNQIPLNEFVERWQPLPDAVERAAKANAEWRERFGSDLGDYVDDGGFYCCSREFS